MRSPLFDESGKVIDREGLRSTGRGLGPAGVSVLADSPGGRVTRTDAGVNVELRPLEVAR